MRLIMILLWATFGGWTAATIRVATSPDADLTPIALAITAVFVAVALWVTVRFEKEKARGPMSVDVSKTIPIHKRCGTPVSTDEKDITLLDGDGESSGYSAACLKCDEDLFPFEVEQIPASDDLGGERS